MENVLHVFFPVLFAMAPKRAWHFLDPVPSPESSEYRQRRVALRTDLLCKSFDFCSSLTDFFLHSHKYFQTSLPCLRLHSTYAALLCAEKHEPCSAADTLFCTAIVDLK